MRESCTRSGAPSVARLTLLADPGCGPVPLAVEALVRPARKRRQGQLARGARGSDAASRWGTPDPATPVLAVTGSGVDAVRFK